MTPDLQLAVGAAERGTLLPRADIEAGEVPADARTRAELTRKFYSGETSLAEEYAGQSPPSET